MDEELAVVECQRCPELCESRSRIVNGVGPSDADLLFVGEAPGEQEDAHGEPFVGRSGSVLDETLRKQGLDRADVRISNCVRCRPPGNRDPHVAELENCREYLEREVAAVDPEVIVTLGKVPSEHLLGRDVAVTTEAGDVHDAPIGDGVWPLLVCVHPAATFYDASQQETLEATIAEAAALVDEEGGQSRLGDY
jgi:DNA polymerase